MNSIEGFFKFLWFIVDREGYPIPQVSLEEGAFPAFLEVDISGNKFEVPTPLVPYVASAKRAGYTKLVYNLVNGADNIGRRTFHKKTINTILRQFNDAGNSSNMRLAHVITSKGLHYYGCRGMIFNENYEPLMLCTLEVEYNAVHNTVNLSHPKCRLSYKVFEDVSNIVEKTIIKQAIPYYANEGIDIYYKRDYFGDKVPVEIVIGHMGSMIVKPMVPTLSTINMTNFNNIIANHYEAY